MKKTIVILVVLLIIFSCRAKKEYTNTVTNDTIKINSIIKITPKQLNSLVIDQPCDSLGNLKPFSYTFGSGKNKTTLKAKNDTIYLEQNNDSIINSWKEEYRSSFKSKDKLVIKEVKRPFNLYSIILNIILAAWIFRKPLIRLIKPL